MLNKNQLFLTILIACWAIVTCKDAVELAVNDTNPATFANLTQLEVKHSNSSKAFPIYEYRCSVGFQTSNNVACFGDDATSWTWPHDVELRLRCPNSGFGVRITYVEIFYQVSSPNVRCFVHEGGIGQNYIGLTINAWSTSLFVYRARFFS